MIRLFNLLVKSVGSVCFSFYLSNNSNVLIYSNWSLLQILCSSHEIRNNFFFSVFYGIALSGIQLISIHSKKAGNFVVYDEKIYNKLEKSLYINERRRQINDKWHHDPVFLLFELMFHFFFHLYLLLLFLLITHSFYVHSFIFAFVVVFVYYYQSLQ